MTVTVDTLRVRVRELESQLAALHVSALYVFGSVARGEAGPHSDVDVLVDFAERPDAYAQFFDVKFLLEEALHVPVDLVTRGALKPRVAAAIAEDLRRVA